MKKLIIAALLSLVTSQAMAVSANDLRLTQRDSGNTANLARDLSFPAASANGVLVFNGSTVLPQAATLAGGLTFNGTSLTTSAIPQANVSGLTASLSGKFDVPAGTTAQYVRGDGSLATMPTASGVTSFNSRTGSVSPAANDYAIADITGLTTALSGKVDTTVTINGHALTSNVTVTKSDIGLGNVDNTADSSKVFAASQITSGTLADARVAQSNVTQHQAALSIASTQVTGTKTSSYISDFGSAARGAAQMYSGVTQKLGAFPIVKSATVSSGTATFHLTSDGTSSGSALFPTGPDKNSVQVIVNDSGASYQMGWAWSNSDKTLTVTCNYYTTANILTGILGQASCPNTKTVNLTVFGN